MSTDIIRISNFNQISNMSRRTVYFIDSGNDAFGSVRFKSRDIPSGFTRENLEIYSQIFLPFLATDSNNNVVILIDMDQLVNFDPVMYSDIKQKALSRAMEETSNANQEPDNSSFLVHPDSIPNESSWTMGIDAVSQARRTLLSSTITELQNKINDMTRKIGEYATDLSPMHENLAQAARPEYFIHQNNSSCWLKFKFQMSQFEADSRMYNLRPDGSSVEFTIHVNYRMHARNSQFSISDVSIAAHSSNRFVSSDNTIISHPIISSEENRDSPRIVSNVCVGDALDSVIKALKDNDFDSVYALIKQAFTVVEGPYVSPSNFFPARG